MLKFFNRKRRASNCITRLLYCLAVGLLPAAHVSADVLLVLSSQQSAYREVADTITQATDVPHEIITLEQYLPLHTNPAKYDTVVAIGSQAADQMFQKLDSKQQLIMSFLPKRTYLSILGKYADHPRAKLANYTGVFLDQPLSRQLNLIRLIKPKVQSISTALGPFSSEQLGTLQAEAGKHNIQIKHVTLDENDNPMQTLQSLITGTDIVLTLPDKSLFNRTIAKWILYISFRQGIPLIGFSEKYVAAGAIAAVFSTPQDIGRQTADILIAHNNGKALPAARYPAFFHVATNPVAARSLHIHLPAVPELQSQLREMEQ